MRLVGLVTLLSAIGLLLLVVFPAESARVGWVRGIVSEVAEYEVTRNKGAVCSVPEAAYVVNLVKPNECRGTAGAAGLPRAAHAAVLTKLWANGVVGVVAFWVGLGVLGVVGAVRWIRMLAGEAGSRVRAGRIFRKRAFRLGRRSDVRVGRTWVGIPAELLDGAYRLRRTERDVCLDLLHVIAQYRGRAYLTSRERSEGRFERQVRLIEACGMKVARGMKVPEELDGLLEICLLAQDTGKMGAFFRRGAGDTFGYAGPQHQSKSAGVLRSLSSFWRLPAEERNVILSLVSSHHEELLRNDEHPAVFTLREIMRKAEHHRGRVAAALGGTV